MSVDSGNPSNNPLVPLESTVATELLDAHHAKEGDHLNIEAMLVEEFKYARETAMQSSQDLMRIFDRYLVLVGGAAVTFVGATYQLNQIGAKTDFLPLIAASMMTILGFLGIVFFIVLIRIRQSTRESMITMSVLKERYLQEFPEYARSFRWRLTTVPAGARVGGVVYLVCTTVAFVDSLCFGGGAYLLYQDKLGATLPTFISWQAELFAAIICVIALSLQLVYFTYALSRRRGSKMILKANQLNW
ncbi:MAG: hypothetical protein OJF49_004365 [Ktedonobacterales bacterium]|jgi:hypothetical protein|nr:MAG: hypothetical protein OJF49_004365 [Ktedonobacterales bacterium]